MSYSFDDDDFVLEPPALQTVRTSLDSEAAQCLDSHTQHMPSLRFLRIDTARVIHDTLAEHRLIKTHSIVARWGMRSYVFACMLHASRFRVVASNLRQINEAVIGIPKPKAKVCKKRRWKVLNQTSELSLRFSDAVENCLLELRPPPLVRHLVYTL